MTTHILLNLPEEYQTIVEILEDELGYEENILTTKKICDKFSVKYDLTNKQLIPRMLREDEKTL